MTLALGSLYLALTSSISFSVAWHDFALDASCNGIDARAASKLVRAYILGGDVLANVLVLFRDASVWCGDRHQ